MRLPEYIKQVGVKKFARQFRLNQRTVVSWIYTERRPRREIAQRIVKRTPVTMEGIYGA